MRISRNLIVFLAVVGGVCAAQTVTVSGNVKTIFGGNSTTRVKVCFTLLTSDGQQPADPHVVGSGVLVPTQTQCIDPDKVTGVFTTPLVSNDSITVAGVLNTTNYSVTYLYNGSPAHGALYNFLLADVTEDLNSKSPVNMSVSPTVTPTDSIYARLDGGNQPFLGAIRSCVQNGWYIAGSSCYATIQAAITTACGASPTGGTVLIPPGTYIQNSSFTLCSNLKLIGSGRCQVDTVNCPTLITTTLSSGDLFPITNMSDIYMSDFGVKSLSAGGANAAIRLNYGQRNVIERLYLNLANFAKGIELDTSGTSAGSTIWNTFRDIHINGMLTTGIACLLDSSNATNKVINNNSFYNVSCTGGPGGVGIKITNSNTLQNINENYFYAGENATSTGVSGGTGILITSTATRGVVFVQQNTESNHLGFSKATANTVTFIGGNISANDTNVTDAQTSFTSYVNTNVGGTVQQWSVDIAGGMNVNCLSLNAACAGLANLVNGASGWGLGISGSQVWQVLTGAFVPITAGAEDLGNTAFPIGNLWLGNTGTNNIKLTGTATGARTQTLQDATGTVPLTIASGTSTLANGALNQQTCAAVVTTAATGALTSDTVSWSFTSAPSTADGSLNYTWYLTAGNVNWKVCNTSAGALTPSGLVINWRIIR